MSGPDNPSRRAFLTGSQIAPPSPPRLGPAPPWLDGRISPGSCRECEQPCIAACPEKIVALHPPDHPDAGLAYLDFREGACTFCRACVEACPQGGLELANGRALPSVVLDPDRCLAAKGVVCVICVARCPERAISGRPGGSVVVSDSACTGCGACVGTCPAQALVVPAG